MSALPVDTSVPAQDPGVAAAFDKLRKYVVAVVSQRGGELHAFARDSRALVGPGVVLIVLDMADLEPGAEGEINTSYATEERLKGRNLEMPPIAKEMLAKCDPKTHTVLMPVLMYPGSVAGTVRPLYAPLPIGPFLGPRACSAVGCKNDGPHRCMRCRRVAYCSKACQKRDWTQRHKAECAAMVAATFVADPDAAPVAAPAATDVITVCESGGAYV